MTVIKRDHSLLYAFYPCMQERLSTMALDVLGWVVAVGAARWVMGVLPWGEGDNNNYSYLQADRACNMGIIQQSFFLL